MTREASQTRIDHVWSNFSYENDHLVFTFPIEKDDIIKTDHSLILVQIEAKHSVDQAPNDKIREKLIHRRIENQLDYRLHDNILKCFDDCDAMADYIIKMIHASIEENRIRIRVKPSREKACEWMNGRVQKFIDLKDELRLKL